MSRSAGSSSSRLLRVRLVEDVDVHVALEHLERVLVEEHRLTFAARCSFVTNGRIHSERNSTGANFSVGNRVARPCPMIDAIASTSVRLVRHQREEPRRAVAHERTELALAEAFPLVDVALVPGVARVHADDDVELGHELPERVELGQRERPPATVRRHRRHAEEERTRTALGDALQLVDRGVDLRETDDRRGEDRVGSS